MMHAILGIVAMAVLTAVFCGFRLADGKGCHDCSGSGDGDCASCSLGGHELENEWRTR